ncbi:hypothetical protein NC651_006924 [Populus alba x Populus x berolinensis]|nr:hypothetical protein NC651_006924 [Populus alba x Populus x berolinensis]
MLAELIVDFLYGREACFCPVGWWLQSHYDYFINIPFKIKISTFICKLFLMRLTLMFLSIRSAVAKAQKSQVLAGAPAEAEARVYHGDVMILALTMDEDAES